MSIERNCTGFAHGHGDFLSRQLVLSLSVLIGCVWGERGGGPFTHRRDGRRGTVRRWRHGGWGIYINPTHPPARCISSPAHKRMMLGDERHTLAVHH